MRITAELRQAKLALHGALEKALMLIGEKDKYAAFYNYEILIKDLCSELSTFVIDLERDKLRAVDIETLISKIKKLMSDSNLPENIKALLPDSVIDNFLQALQKNRSPSPQAAAREQNARPQPAKSAASPSSAAPPENPKKANTLQAALYLLEKKEAIKTELTQMLIAEDLLSLIDERGIRIDDERFAPCLDRLIIFIDNTMLAEKDITFANILDDANAVMILKGSSIITKLAGYYVNKQRAAERQRPEVKTPPPAASPKKFADPEPLVPESSHQEEPINIRAARFLLDEKGIEIIERYNLLKIRDDSSILPVLIYINEELEQRFRDTKITFADIAKDPNAKKVFSERLIGQTLLILCDQLPALEVEEKRQAEMEKRRAARERYGIFRVRDGGGLMTRANVDHLKTALLAAENPAEARELLRRAALKVHPDKNPEANPQQFPAVNEMLKAVAKEGGLDELKREYERARPKK
jgi:hypothetical protein